MSICTLGQLMVWLLESPRTRLETLRATEAKPEDVSAAISLLIARNHLCVPVHAGRRMLFRVRAASGAGFVLKQPIEGCHARNRFRDTDLLRDWIDVAIQDAARIWLSRAEACGSEAEAAVLAESFLANRLGRRATDREAVLFWDLVDLKHAPHTRYRLRRRERSGLLAGWMGGDIMSTGGAAPSTAEIVKQCAAEYVERGSRPPPLPEEDVTLVALDGDAFLAARLGPKPTGEESQLFWDEVESRS